MRRITIGLALLFGAMIALPATSSADQEVCGELDSGKINTSGNPLTVTMTAPGGNLITQYCVKAGSDSSVPDGAVEYITLSSPQASIVVPHPSGKSVSHYSFAWVPIVDQSSTSTTTTTTTTIPQVEESSTTTTTTTQVEEEEESSTSAVEVIVAVAPPPPQVASKAPAAPSPAPDALPSTGTSSWTIVLIGIVTLGSGLGLIRIARREEEEQNLSM